MPKQTCSEKWTPLTPSMHALNSRAMSAAVCGSFDAYPGVAGSSSWIHLQPAAARRRISSFSAGTNASARCVRSR